MLNLEPELETIRPILGDELTDELVRRERREVFSLQPELRLLAWGGAMLLAAAAALVLKNNIDRIGPLALAILIGGAAVACYAFVYRRRRNATFVHDYILLLGALLISADVAFIETQFKLLGDVWHRHFLIVAILHGTAAYVFRSRVVLSLAITAVAAWLGVERGGIRMFDVIGSREPIELAIRAFTASAAVLAWRVANRREEFTRTFEHFAANLALLGALLLCDETEVMGALLTMSLGALVMWWGFRVRAEPFVLYGFVYSVIGLGVLVVTVVNDGTAAFFIVVLMMIAAIVSLVAMHTRFERLSR